MPGFDAVYGPFGPVRGRVVPRGWRLVPAVVAGLLWLVAVALLLRVPGDFGWARQHLRSSPGDNIVWFWPQLEVVALVLALTVAHGLSIVAHGGRRAAPSLVLGSRYGTWGTVIVTVMTAGLLA